MYAKPGLDQARGGSLAERWIPALRWARDYGAGTLTADLLAALIVTVMLIPQSLAYAMLAGLPPETGLYASILPLVAYALFGTSRTLSVGPVAVISLLTASALGQAGFRATSWPRARSCWPHFRD
jgi:SulP family sulfate permease